jgi:dihydrolipoamide dehydrogenase
VATNRYELVIVGAGSAGIAAHATAKRLTDSLLIVEGGVGGTMCARVGCMPSKLLIAAAEAKRAVDSAPTFGVAAGQVVVDGAAVMQRVRAMRDDFVGSVLSAMAKVPAAQKMAGMARFLDPHTLQVGDQRVEADRIILATGSYPLVPPAFQALGDRVLTTDQVFELPTLPASLAIVGGGAVGLELGQAFHRLGVRVRVFHSGKTLGPSGDSKITAAATALFTAELPCELGVTVAPVARTAHHVELGWTDAGGAARHEVFDYVLVATGRRPALAGLDLARSGLAVDERGVPRFDRSTMRCGDSHVFLAGDVDADEPLLHVAAEEGRIAAENAAAYPNVNPVTRTVPLAIAFTSPAFAMVGQSLAARDPKTTVVGEVSFERQGRSRVMAQNVGLLRVYADWASGRLVGAQLIGPDAEHLAHLIAWAVQLQLTVDQALALPFYHPVVEEALRTALKHARSQLQVNAPVAPTTADCLDCGPAV